VNRGGRANDAEFERTMSASSAEVQELARAVRDLVFDVAPHTVEVVCI
jgi:NTP pyrophosphatase (non-canonical NTP hydrolase)